MKTIPITITLELDQARKCALTHLSAEAARVLPEGWEVHFKPHFGIYIYQNGKLGATYHMKDGPARMAPIGLSDEVLDLFSGCITFCYLFGADREILNHKGLA